MKNTIHVAALLVCHNRRPMTARALQALKVAALDSGVEISISAFDDASTDDTTTEIRSIFPDARITHGNGAAFWNKGLSIAWHAAADLPVVAFLWLNDDVVIDADTLKRTKAAWDEAMHRRPDENFILVGTTRGPDGAATYGGKRRIFSPWALKFEDVPPSHSLQPVDAFNGNYVLVPRKVVERIGFNDAAFFHNMGDIDYGLRARQAGIDVWLMPETIGSCSANVAKERQGYGSPDLTLRQQWKKVNSHHGVPFLSWARLTFRHSGALFPLHFLLPYRRLIFPRWLLRRIGSA